VRNQLFGFCYENESCLNVFCLELQHGIEPVHGEFLLTPRLAFGIDHNNVSATDTI